MPCHTSFSTLSGVKNRPRRNEIGWHDPINVGRRINQIKMFVHCSMSIMIGKRAHSAARSHQTSHSTSLESRQQSAFDISLHTMHPTMKSLLGPLLSLLRCFRPAVDDNEVGPRAVVIVRSHVFVDVSCVDADGKQGWSDRLQP